MRAQKKALLMSTAFLRRYATTRRQPSLSAPLQAKYGRGTATDFQPALAIEPFASPFLGPVEPVFLEAERLVSRVA